jgi:N-acetylneuraminic acid mutarotase
MIIWGAPELTGGRYDPSTDTWDPTSTVNAPATFDSTVVWSGTEMIVWGGSSFDDMNTGARYDPIADTWTPTSLINAPVGRSAHTAVWTGTEMIVWGGRGNGAYLDTGGRYNPATDNWTPTATTNAPVARADHTAVWTGTLMIVWGGHGDVSLNAGGRFDPTTDTWSPTHPTSTTDAPAGRAYHTGIWTGNEMIVWGGYGIDSTLNSGGRYNPATDTWTPTSKTAAPGARFFPTGVWTGTEMIVWGGNEIGEGDTPGTGGRYNPVTDTWAPTSATNAPSVRTGHSAVWTGTRMIVWGGGSLPVPPGGLYDPATDTWGPMSTVGAPDPGLDSTSVWTGTEMIVWGRTFANGPPEVSGGRYDPATDTWKPMSITNAPEPHQDPTAVWTGKEMIVWGGLGQPFDSSGGRYDPGTDSWTPTSITGAPTPRAGHTSVWTGTEMIVWGGWSPLALDTGGGYDPATDRWTPTSTDNAPVARTDHTAVWTGTRMIVWGGDQFAGGPGFDTGGLYVPATASPPPTADAGADVVVECASVAGTPVQLHAAATGCGSLTFTWTGSFTEGGGTVQGRDAAVTVPLGQTTITLKVTDGQGQSATDTVLVTVRDTAAPTLTLLADPQFLWPPNAALVPVHVTGRVIDACDPNPALALVSVTSSEPDDAPGPGDGRTTGDISGADLGSPDLSLDLRAERDSHGPGRVYRLTYGAVDASGNSTTAFTVVTVPHDMGSDSATHSRPPH